MQTTVTAISVSTPPRHPGRAGNPGGGDGFAALMQLDERAPRETPAEGAGQAAAMPPADPSPLPGAALLAQAGPGTPVVGAVVGAAASDPGSGGPGSGGPGAQDTAAHAALLVSAGQTGLSARTMAERRATAEDPALRPATDAAFPAGGGPAPVSGPGAAPLAGLPEALPQGDLPVRNSGLIADARSAAMPGKATEAPPTDANGADGAEAPVRRADAVAAAGAVASGVAGAMPSAAPDPAQGQPKAAAEAVPPVVKPDPPPPDAAAGERPALAAAAAVGPNDPGPTQVERAVSDKRTPASDQTLPAPLANPVPARLWQGVFLDARGGPLRPEAPPGDAPAERVARDVAADPARPRPEPGWAVTAAARALALAVIDPLAHAQPDPLGLGEGQVPDGRGLAEAAMGVGSMAGTVGGSTHAVAPGALPQLWSQVAGALARRADGATELTLAPEELGRVRVTLQADEHCADRVVVLLSFDRPETMDLFRRHADQLAAALQAAGYSEASISFAQGGGSEGDGSERMPRMAAEHQDNPAGPPAKPEPSPEPSLLARAGGTSLDLRL